MCLAIYWAYCAELLTFHMHEIWGSYSGEDVDFVLQPWRSRQHVFWNVGSIYKFTWWHNPENNIDFRHLVSRVQEPWFIKNWIYFPNTVLWSLCNWIGFIITEFAVAVQHTYSCVCQLSWQHGMGLWLYKIVMSFALFSGSSSTSVKYDLSKLSQISVKEC
jgi:hypothetical protein